MHVTQNRLRKGLICPNYRKKYGLSEKASWHGSLDKERKIKLLLSRFIGLRDVDLLYRLKMRFFKS